MTPFETILLIFLAHAYILPQKEIKNLQVSEYHDGMDKDKNPFKHTLGSISFIKNEVLKIAKVTSIIIQVITALFYAYMAVVNYQSWVYEIAYALLFIASVVLFILGLVYQKKDEDEAEAASKKKQHFKRAKFLLKSLNYVVRLFLIGIAVFAIITNANTSNAFLLTTMVSGTLFFIGLTMEIIGFLVLRYVDYLTFAINRDIEENAVLNVAKNVANPMKFMEAITDRMAGRKEEERTFTSKEEAMEDNIISQRNEDLRRKSAKDEKNKQEKAKENEEHKKRIKENLRTIRDRFFKPKDKKD